MNEEEQQHQQQQRNVVRMPPSEFPPCSIGDGGSGVAPCEDDEETIAYSNIHHHNDIVEDNSNNVDDCENDVTADHDEFNLIPSPPRKRGGPQHHHYHHPNPNPNDNHSRHQQYFHHHQQQLDEKNHFRGNGPLSAFSPPRNTAANVNMNALQHQQTQAQIQARTTTTSTLDQFFYSQRPKVKYYRIIYRGFVALLNDAESDSKKSGAYVSYGEIIASTKEFDVKVQLQLPDNNDDERGHYDGDRDRGENDIGGYRYRRESCNGHGHDNIDKHEAYSGISSPSRKNGNINDCNSSSLSTISPAAAAAADAASAISSSIATLSINNGSYVTTATTTTASSSSLPIVPSTSFGVIPQSQPQHHHEQQQQYHQNQHHLSPSSPSRRITHGANNDINNSSPRRHQQQLNHQPQQNTHTTIRIIQVDDVLTGGYAIDALTKGTSHTHHTPRRSNAKNGTFHDGYPNTSSNSRCDGSITTITSMTDRSHGTDSSTAGNSNNSTTNANNGHKCNQYNVIPGGIDRGGLRNINMMGYNEIQKGDRINGHEKCDDCNDPNDQNHHHGYLFQSRNGISIAECIPSPPLLCQPGPFYYRVVSTVPLPILAGPCADAPVTRAMALPGTVHEISLRMGSVHGYSGSGSNGHGGNSNNSSPMSSPGRGGVGSTGLEDGIVYLRLSHRRGWIADRRYVLLPSSSPFQDNNNNHHQQNQHHSNYNKISRPSSPRQSPIPTRGHRRNGSGGSYFSTSSRRRCIELVMKEVSDYVDVTSFAIRDDISLGGTSISSASIATPASVIRTRRRPVRRRNERDRRRGHDNRSGMVVLPKIKRRENTSQSKAHGIEALPSPVSDVSLQSDLSNKNSTSLQGQSQSNDKHHGVITNSSADKESNIDESNELKPNVFLLRVTAPNGLKILDAPSFQVSNLIRGQGSTSTMPFMKTYNNSTSSEASVSKSVASATTINPSSIFHTMNGSSQSDFGRARSWELDASGKKRILPRGALFEASNRMERAGTFAHGSGLIKLADGTGWAIVPNKDELLEQYAAFQGGSINLSETEVSKAYEEVGNAVVMKSNQQLDFRYDSDSSWVRIVQSTGVLVSCTPSSSQKEDQRAKHNSPISSAYSSDSSHSRGSIPLDSDASSAVSSVFGAFRPSKRQEVKVDNISVVSASRKRSRVGEKVNLIPCGTCVQVEHWVASKSHPERQVRSHFKLSHFTDDFWQELIDCFFVHLVEFCKTVWWAGLGSTIFPWKPVFCRYSPT